MRKRVFSIIMSLLMVITMIPLFAVDSHATEPIDYFYIKNESNEQLRVTISHPDPEHELSDSITLQWTTNLSGDSWNNLVLNKDFNDELVTILNNNGDKVYIRYKGDGNIKGLPNTMETQMQFQVRKSYSAGGDIRTLIANPTKVSLDTVTSLNDFAFSDLFRGQEELLSYDGDLLAGMVGEEAYCRMFYGCKNLQKAPNISATTLGKKSCSDMFRNCESLEKPPIFSPVTLNDSCCQYMFYSCISLKTPPELNATTVPLYGYDHMFYGCTSLQCIPDLPAQTTGALAYCCMFENCTKLKIYSEIPDDCFKTYNIPSNGYMQTIGNNFGKEMFKGTGGVISPSANTTYYILTGLDHTFSSYSWKDEEKHIAVCSACGSVIDENHSFGEPTISNGLKVSECIHCGFKHIEAAPSTGGGSTILPEATVEELDKLKNEVEELKEEIEFIKTAPALSSIKIKPKKKRINLTLEKVKGATHYQICVKRKGKKSKTIEFSAENNTKTIRHLKSGKKYSIKVRAVKKKDKSVTCGKWSKAKYVRVK